jgi:hypothetical protein
MDDDLVRRLSSIADILADLFPEFSKDINSAADRIEKLRGALRLISDDGNWGPNGCWDAYSYPDEIARAALGEEENDD